MRPIANSSSCSTLIDIEVERKADFQEEPEIQLEQSFIILPNDDDQFGLYLDEEDGGEEVTEYLYLPKSSEGTNVKVTSLFPLDRYLSIIPSLQESADFLLNQSPRVLSSEDDSRVLNVCQGEVAHAVPSQCDVIASDHATTCHIIAIRSVSEDANAEPLTSMAHIDKPGYESCIRNIIQTHKRHHGKTRINMDLHLMGGFNDADNSSRKISESLITTFSRISSEESETLSLTLKTCAISHMNDNGYNVPIGRGLGVDLASGKVSLVKIKDSVVGPASILRSCRLWSRESRNALSLVHDHEDVESTITIRPFKFQPFKGMTVLLSLPDDIMLQYTSTSPDVEHEDFCDNVRRTLQYIKNTDCEQIFGPDCSKPISFSRISDNRWTRC